MRKKHYELVTKLLKENKVFYECDYDENSSEDLLFECDKNSIKFFIQLEYSIEVLAVVQTFLDGTEHNNESFMVEGEYDLLENKWLNDVSVLDIEQVISDILNEVAEVSKRIREYRNQLQKIFDGVNNIRDLNILTDIFEEFSDNIEY